MFRTARRTLFGGAFLTLFGAACYSTGDGVDPPPNDFYYPVGLAVSRGGSALYTVNSNFDLQWNAGTIQSYDLNLIRTHALAAIRDPKDAILPLAVPGNVGTCPSGPVANRVGGSATEALETCAPIVQSSFYVRDSAHIGAFATDMQILDGRRLFVPTRGNASLTYVDVAADDTTTLPPADPNTPYAPFQLDCGVRDGARCNGSHEVGANPNEEGNSRHITMPGEPFGLALSEDGSSAIITHQSEGKASLFSTGMKRGSPDMGRPAIQFILEEQLPVGGNGVAAVPHCLTQPDGSACAPSPPRPAFLLTSRVTRDVSLIRYYDDDATGGAIRRPFLRKEATYSLDASVNGNDSRGIAIDPTPRIACLLNVQSAGGTRTAADVAAETTKCNETPARVFIANRAPASLIYGEVGSRTTESAAANPDRVTVSGTIPVSNGPSRVYLGPIVDRNGRYALRVFVVCFDALAIYVIDPETLALENVIRVAPGPYALAFDPFSWEDVAMHRVAAVDARNPSTHAFRFGYLASFTQSFVQIIDLDAASDHPQGFENIVMQLGKPTNPKGSF